MPITKKPTSNYHVDGRVSIALDALDEKNKKAISKVIRDRDHFLAYADCGTVETISKKRSVYAVSVPTDLSIIYRVSGDHIEVLDLMGKAVLRRYGAKKPGRTKSHKKTATSTQSS